MLLNFLLGNLQTNFIPLLAGLVYFLFYLPTSTKIKTLVKKVLV